MKSLLIVVAIASSTVAQQKTDSSDKSGPKAKSNPILFLIDQSVITEHTTTIKVKKVPYKATTGTMPVWDEDGKQLRAYFTHLL
jgi:carboxypeptidase C (cathepsin A)